MLRAASRINKSKASYRLEVIPIHSFQHTALTANRAQRRSHRAASPCPLSSSAPRRHRARRRRTNRPASAPTRRRVCPRSTAVGSCVARKSTQCLERARCDTYQITGHRPRDPPDGLRRRLPVAGASLFLRSLPHLTEPPLVVWGGCAHVRARAAGGPFRSRYGRRRSMACQRRCVALR